MLEFALIAGAVALGTVVFLVRPLIARREQALGQDAADAQIFRDQLDEVERDLARGTINEAEAEGARVEVSRRLLAAAARAESATELTPAPQGHSGLVAGLALIGTPALAAALYFGIGAPGMPDQPLSERRNLDTVQMADRPSQAEAEAQVQAEGALPLSPEAADEEYKALVERLEGVVAERPDDRQGHLLLANGLMRLGRWNEAWRMYQKAIVLSDGQEGADLHASQAEAMILAAGGYVSPEAEQALAQALQIDPSLPMARYYAGLSLRQAGRLDEAIAVWDRLRRESPPNASYMEWLNTMLAETIEANGGTAGPGPSQGEIEAAENLTPEERQEMIDGMIARLRGRLTTEGGSPEEWAQLIASYAAIGAEDEAKEAFDLALVAYPEGATADALKAHAGRLGIEGGTEQAATPGPSQEDIEAANEMSAEDRAAMIESMVARLEDRVTSRGGTPEEWVRLINAFVQLDRKTDAERIYRLSQESLSREEGSGFVKEQALLMGIEVQ